MSRAVNTDITGSGRDLVRRGSHLRINVDYAKCPGSCGGTSGGSYIGNIYTMSRREGSIVNRGTQRYPKWMLNKES